jgi:hypothetical protein
LLANNAKTSFSVETTDTKRNRGFPDATGMGKHSETLGVGAKILGNLYTQASPTENKHCLGQSAESQHTNLDASYFYAFYLDLSYLDASYISSDLASTKSSLQTSEKFSEFVNCYGGRTSKTAG